MANLRLSNEYVMNGYTALDNIFVCEYMNTAPDNYVKIYIYGLYLASNSKNATTEDITNALKIDESEVINAFKYFEDMGLINLLSISPLDVVYIPITANMKPKKIKPGKYAEFNKQVESIIQNRMILPNEFEEYYFLMEHYHIEPPALIMIMKYCTDLKGKDISLNYIRTVAKNFAFKKITTLKAVEDELSTYTLQNSQTAQILKALNIKRAPDLEEQELYKKWTKDWQFEKEAILKTASLIKGSMKKLDSVLAELYKYKKFSSSEIEKYIKKKNDLKTFSISINRTLGVYYETVDFEIEVYINPWLQMGFTAEVLIKIAEFCFMRSKRRLEDMDEVVKKFSKLGIFSENSLNSYINELIVTDKKIQGLLNVLELDRKVNSYDRENYRRFSVVLGFTDEMIYHAASIAKNSTNPYPYMNAVLNKWKDNNIYDVEKAKAFKLCFYNNNDKNKRDDFLRHEYTEEELNSMFDNIDDIEI